MFGINETAGNGVLSFTAVRLLSVYPMSHLSICQKRLESVKSLRGGKLAANNGNMPRAFVLES